MRYRPSDRTIVALIAMLAVAIRIVWQVRTGFYQGPLAFEEDEIARNILAGRGYSYWFQELGLEVTTYALAGLPLLLVLLHAIDPGYTLIGLVQAGLSIIVVAAAYVIGKDLLSPRAGILAAAVVAIHPGLIIMAARAVISPVYDQAVAAIAFVTVLALVRHRAAVNGVRLGLASALGLLMRPTVAVACAAVLGVLALRPPRRAIGIAAAILIAVPLAISARSALSPGAQSSSTMFCIQLWTGNNPEASGGAFTADGKENLFLRMPPELNAVVGRPADEIGRAFCDVTFAWLLEDIPRSVGWQLTKFYYFWWFSPLAGILYPPGWIEAYRILYTGELAFAAAGAMAIWRRGWRAGLLVLALMMVTIAATQVVFYVEGRHRLIVEAPLAAISCCGLVWLVDRARGSAPRIPALSAIRVARGLRNGR